MRKRYANAVGGEYTQLRVDTEYFNGYVCDIKISGVERPLIVNNGKNDVCIKDNGYEWIEVYPDNANYAITIMFDKNKNLIEWYFDIAKEVGIENGIPYEDDLYLDMIITSRGEKLIIDEEDLKSALADGIIKKEDVELAYQTLEQLEKRYANNVDGLIDLTNDFYKMFNEDNLNKLEKGS